MCAYVRICGADSAILAAARAEAHGTPALRGATELDEPGSAPESWDARHPLAAALAGSTPGPSLVAALAELTPRELSDPALSEAVAAWERVISWATARQAEVLAEMARRTRGDAVRFVADDVAFTLAVSRRAAERKVAFAVGLAHAPGSTVPQIRTAIRRAELTIDPEVVAVRCARARADRSVRMVPAPDSMAWITAYLPAEGAGMVMTALDALSSTCAPQDDRPMDDRRADALGDVLGAVLDRGVDLDGSDLPTRQRRRPHLQVTLGAGTLLGLDDLPAELAGYGPIPADLARRIAQDATWRAILTDPGTGEVLARGQRTYRPGADLAGAVVDRDATCTFPGCRIRADRCDIDHIEPYDPVRVETEQTRIDNLQALCRHHHRLKTSGRWSCARDPATGATTWTAPTGRTVIRAPVPVEPRFAPVGEAWPSPDPPWGDLGHH